MLGKKKKKRKKKGHFVPNYRTPVVSNHFLFNVSGKVVRSYMEPRDFSLR